MCTYEYRKNDLLLICASSTTDRILTESPLLAPSCFLYRMLSNLMNALDGECFCFLKISINVNKLLALLLFHVLSVFLYCTLLLVVNFLMPFYFFFLRMLLYFCLFINHVNKPLYRILYKVCQIDHFRTTKWLSCC